MRPPLVSVVIPTWNRADLLLSAVRSVLAQTAPDLEVLVVDDGSTDDSADRIAALGDPRVRWMAGSHEGSVAAVRNRGVRAARGRWVGFLDSDDRWLPTRVARQLARLASYPDAWCHCGYRMVDAAGSPIPQASGPSWEAREGDLLEAVIAGTVTVSLGTVLATRDLLRSLGPADVRLRRREDFEYMLRLAAAAPAVAVNQTLVEYREHSGRRTRTAPGAHDYAAQSYLRFMHGQAPRATRAALRWRGADHVARALPAGVFRGSWWAALRLLVTP